MNYVKRLTVALAASGSIGFCAALVCDPVFARGGSHGGASHSGESHAPAHGTHSVKDYSKNDGTHVEQHRKTNPDDTKNNNWSTKGNVNPDTGKAGTKPGDK